jgi:pyruvate dehydrogenase E2 component (dihydrolipoamide acetyltransferase)
VKGEERRVRVSPYAAKLAARLGVNVSKLKGSGVGGRIMARDVEAAAGGHATVEAAPPSADEEIPPIEVTPDEAEVVEAPFRLKTQARRVVASKHVIPHFYMTASADVTDLMRRRSALKEKYGATVTHLVMLACLKAVGEVPEVNRSYDHGRIIRWKHVNLGLAIQTEQGLTVAVLPAAEGLALKDIVGRAAALIERARAGKLSAEDRRHPTFTVSNLGMFGVEHFEPIINPPSSVTLGVAAAAPTPVVRGEGLYVAQVMRLTASCDHRIVDGVTAARLLQALTGLLADPGRLLEGQ